MLLNIFSSEILHIWGIQGHVQGKPAGRVDRSLEDGLCLQLGCFGEGLGGTLKSVYLTMLGIIAGRPEV